MTLKIDIQHPIDLDAFLSREWLITNGLGGYASGTVTGVNTRRYHGLLVAAMEPPVRRMLLLAELEEWLFTPGLDPQPLSAQEYWDGTIFPEGFNRLQALEVEGMLPRFRWSIDGRIIEKRIWMEQGANRTVISYELEAGDAVSLRLRPLFAHRDYHEQRHGPGGFDMAEMGNGWIVDAAGIRSHLEVLRAATVTSQPDWYWRILHRVERERGLDAEEDLFTPGYLDIDLEPGATAALVIGTEPLPPAWSMATSLDAAEQRQAAFIDLGGQSPLARQLLVAAEQFRVTRCFAKNPPPQPSSPQERESSHPLPNPPHKGEGGDSRTVIAGYHWFTDWGRDSMISLPGLTMRPGTLWEARAVLDTNIQYLDQGLIPNRFPDRGEAPEYNTIDATLWMFQALSAYLAMSGDWRFIHQRLEALESIIDWHLRGTKHNIRVDPSDGLLAGGEDGYALTWMDARVQDWTVTPRRGKPIEVNALWYNALRLLADWCERAGKPAGRYREMAVQAYESADRRYWCADAGYFYDCVDGPEGDDRSLRPNQVIAFALVYPFLEGERARAALEMVTRNLLTPYGLRTLAPDDSRYVPVYRGDQQKRDGAYHMGMVWPWLLGPYLDARRRLCGEKPPFTEYLDPFIEHLQQAGLGTVSEIFEPEPPYRPVGCVAQAWSVAELLRHAGAGG